MNNINLSSNSIKVFPFARYRSTAVDISSRLFYEYNVARLINQLIDTKGFIISGSVKEDDCTVTNTLSFNIGGYYFEVSIGTSLRPSDSSNSVYAYIILSDSVTDENNQQTPPELLGQDDQNEFKALNLCDEEPVSVKGTVIYLKIAEKGSDGKWKLSDDSYKKFSLNSLTLNKIDGKH